MPSANFAIGSGLDLKSGGGIHLPSARQELVKVALADVVLLGEGHALRCSDVHAPECSVTLHGVNSPQRYGFAKDEHVRCSTDMDTRTHQIECLRALVKAKGGLEAVADVVDCNPNNLRQIINGIKLPSGNPRGIGPTLHRQLTAAFPGWDAIGAEPAIPIKPGKLSLPEALEVLGLALSAAMPAAVRAELAAALAAWAQFDGKARYRNLVAELLNSASDGSGKQPLTA